MVDLPFDSSCHLPFESSCLVGPSVRFVVPACDHGAFPCLVHYDLAIELPMVGPGASRLAMVVEHQLGLPGCLGANCMLLDFISVPLMCSVGSS